MYNAIKKINKKKRLKKVKRGDKILKLAIIMFISFSFLNFCLIFNFINILNNTII